MFISKLYLKIRLFKVNWQKNRGKLSKSSLSPALVRGFLLSRFPTQPFISCQGDAIFFRIKRQTYTRPLKTLLFILKINNLKACICLPNTYTTYTRVVTPWIFIKWAIIPYIWLYEQKACIWCVWLVYMLGKHIHAPKRFDTQLFITHFSPPCICLAFNSKKKFAFALFLP